MNMKFMLVMVVMEIFLLDIGRFLTDVYAEDAGIEYAQVYSQQGHEAVLKCRFESNRMMWRKKVNGVWIIIANQAIVFVNYTSIYNVSANPETGLYYRLHVLNAQPNEEGFYRCNGREVTEEYHIQLSLYVPPSILNFTGSLDNKLEGIEGTNFLIKCVAVGGKPPPNVSITNGIALNGIQEVNYTIPNISREYHQKSIICHATSDALVNPMSTTVQIYLNLKSLTPIFNTNVSTEETMLLIVSCTSYGSRPAATFTWTIDGNNVTSSSSITSPVTEANGTKTVTSTLTANVNRSHNNKIITCKASNTVGGTSTSKTLDVKYAPDIIVNSPNYTKNDVTRTVTCNPNGNPDSYIYHKWQHKSKYGEIIREWLVGNKTLLLPDVPPLFRYQDSGVYVCTAGNGIKDKHNKFEQTGSGYVTVNAQPVFTSDTRDRLKQFGEIDKDVDISVNVYSISKLTIIWEHDGTPIAQNSPKYESSSSPTIVKDKINDKEVQLDGYNVTLTIHDLEAKDFTNYTVTLRNDYGNATYTIILESASVPETPGNFSKIASSSTSITIQWDPNSGGGYKQTFYLQYRVQGLLEWTTKLVGEEGINELKRRRTHELKNVQEGKAYELRMFAENTAMKKSNLTEVLIVFTDSGAGPSVAAIVGGIAGGLAAIIIVLLVIVCFQKKRKESGTPSKKLRVSSESEDEDGLKDNILYESSQSDRLKKSVLCQSAGSDFESQKKPSTSSEYAEVQKPNAIYAEVNKVAQPEKGKEKKKTDKKGKPKKARKEKTKAMNNNPEEEYANSALPLRNLNDGEYANSTDSQGPSDHHTKAHGLEYADLTFGKISAQNKKQVIHGNDERTIYADVDHTKKAPPPPPESEYEETNIKHGKMA